MLYRPRKSNWMWDTWLYYRDGVHYLYYLHRQHQDMPARSGQRDGVSLATSTDGVHFDEVGPVVLKEDDSTRLGSGSVWPVGDKFAMNFCERREGRQAIFLAKSNDLVHWQRLGDEYRCDPDPQWYDDTAAGRWDCVNVLPRPGGGLVGYLTARPWSHTPGLTYESIGKVESEDGLHWRAVAPPTFDWGEWPKMNVHEVTGLAKIGDLHYLLMAYTYSITGSLGHRHDWDNVGIRVGTHTFVADSIDGPFRPDRQAYPLLVSDPPPEMRTKMMTMCLRFHPTPEGMLMYHHSVAQSNRVWFSPLKRAVVDGGGHLSLGYWRGNDALKGTPIDIDLASCTRVGPTQDHPDGRLFATEFTTELEMSSRRLEINEAHGGGLLLLDNHFDLERGIVLEGTLEIYEPPKRWSGIGVFVEKHPHRAQGTAILAQTRGRTEIGPMKQGNDFRPDDVTEKGIASGTRTSFRLLLRHSLVEFYLDDLLIQCYSLPDEATGRLGLVFESGRAVFEDVKAWVMC